MVCWRWRSVCRLALCAKRFGEKRVLGAGLLGVAAGSLLLGQAWNFQTALAFRGLTIFGYRFAFVSVLIAVALTAPSSLERPHDGSPRCDIGVGFCGGLRRSAVHSPTTWAGGAPFSVTLHGAVGVVAFLLFYRPAQVEGSKDAGAHALALLQIAVRFSLPWSGFSR
jgi:hypothetical protein